MSSELTKGQKRQYKKEVNKLKEDYNEFKKSIKKEFEELKSWADSEYQQIKEKSGLSHEKEQEIEELKKSIAEKVTEISNLYSDIFTNTEESESFKTQIENLLLNSNRLFEETENKKEDFDEFYKKVFGEKNEETGEVIGGLDNKLEQILNDIKLRKHDIDSLLEKVTTGSLLDGFLKSKKEYKQIPEYLTEKDESSVYIRFIRNLFIFISNKFGILFEYLLFILPLFISVIIFVQPSLLTIVLHNTTDNIPKYLGELNFLSRLVISLPLWWISWFGQRSISQKKRLSEEYNHKAQVTKMYLNFSSRDTADSYPIDDKAKMKLDKLLIEVIGRNPSEVYGKDETFLDKVLKIKKPVSDIKESVKDTVDKVVNN